MSDRNPRVLDAPELPGQPYNPSSPFQLSSPLGPRNLGGGYHYGVDFRAPIGTGIPAAADGIFKYSKVMDGYGNVAVIEHMIGGVAVTTVYGHLKQLSQLKNDTPVKAGDIIGYSGSSGRGTGPHLHFEIIPTTKNTFVAGRPAYNPAQFNFPARSPGTAQIGVGTVNPSAVPQT